MLPELRAGLVLVAPPLMQDSRFSRSVIMLCEHGPNGTLGVCLNKPLPMTLTNLGLDLDPWLEQRELYWGGPVNTHVVSVLHPRSFRMPNTVAVTQTVAMTSNPRMFNRIQSDPPRGFSVAAGFSVWGPDQLAAEIQGDPPYTQASSWLVLDPGPDWEPWDQDPDQLWNQSVERAAQSAVKNWF